MIKHVVMWTVKEPKQENLRKAVEMLEGLKDKVEVIRALDVGVDFSDGEASYDLALIVEVSSKEDLAVYRDHPEHVKVAEFIGQIRKERAVVDFEG